MNDTQRRTPCPKVSLPVSPPKTTNGGLVRGQEHGNATHTIAANRVRQTGGGGEVTPIIEIVEIAAPTLQLLEWLDERPRTYRETIDAWHSHCPRLTPWEDALDAGLVRVARSQVAPSASGRAALTAAAHTP